MGKKNEGTFKKAEGFVFFFSFVFFFILAGFFFSFSKYGGIFENTTSAV